MSQIFADYNATTPIAPEVFQAMSPYLESNFGNPSSWHQRGRAAKNAIELARQQVADLIGALPQEITFTGGATEANNWVLKGFRDFPESGPPTHILSSAIEHPSILECCRFLARKGWAEFSTAPIDAQGFCQAALVQSQLRPHTTLVALMLANNETGAIQPVADVARMIQDRAWLHCDGAQAVGKIPVSVRNLGVDSLTIAGHKIYAPKGVGALYLKNGRKLEPLLHGPAQESGLRAGTEGVANIVALGQACHLAKQSLLSEGVRLAQLRDQLWARLQEQLPGQVVLNGPTQTEQKVPHTLSLNFLGVSGHELLQLADVACSTGPACHDGQNRLSHVLEAMGVPFEVGRGAVRISLGRYSTSEDCQTLAERLVASYQSMSKHPSVTKA